MKKVVFGLATLIILLVSGDYVSGGRLTSVFYSASYQGLDWALNYIF